MAIYRKNQVSYGMGNPLVDVFNAPIVSGRAPTARDRAEIGTVWCQKDVAGTDNVYIMTSITANVSRWTNCGGGSGAFDAVTVNPGNLTVTAGNAIVTAGNVTITAGDLALGSGSITVTDYATAGVVINDAAGLLATSAGANGEVLIGSAGLAPVWATLTGGGGINIAEAAGTITISNPGATGTTSGTDVGGPVAPTVGGLTTFEGYDPGVNANITTDGATANTVRIRLADNILSVGSITAASGLAMNLGTCTILSDTNAADSIYLHTDAGVNETVRLRSHQGTGNDAVFLQADAGGVAVRGGLAGADSISLNATNAAGGITVDYGTGGLAITGANGAFIVETGTAAVTIGADLVAKAVSLGNATGASSLALAAGTGNFAATSTALMTLDSVGDLSINSSTGDVNLATDNIAQLVNLGIGAAIKTVTIGNTNATSQVIVDCGTLGVSLGASANAHPVVVGSTNTTSALTLQAGTGATTVTAGGIFDVNAVGAVTIDSTGGTLSLGAGADANGIAIGTGAAARLITVGNNTGGTSVVIDVGTGAFDLGITATDHITRLGSVTGGSALTLRTGTDALTFTAGGTFDVNATGLTTIDSTGGIISIGNGADAFGLNLGTGGAARPIVLGNATGATSVNIYAGTGDCTLGSNATDHSTNVGSTNGVSATNIGGGTGGIALAAAGLVTVTPATDSQAGAATTINANLGVSIHTGLTTAAAAQQTLTITNSLCTAGSAILCSCSNLGANDAKINIERITPAVGSFTVDVINTGAAALNGNILITFWIIAA